MAMVIDPVCGMRIESTDAVATVERDGVTSFFCSEACRDAFVGDPLSYLAGAAQGEGGFLTEQEIAARAGTTVERVRELIDLGLLESAAGGFRPRDVMRVRVVEELRSKGLDTHALAFAHATGHLTF